MKKKIKFIIILALVFNLSLAGLNMLLHNQPKKVALAQGDITCTKVIPIGEAVNKTINLLNVLYTNLQTIRQTIPSQIESANEIPRLFSTSTTGAIDVTSTCSSFKNCKPFCINSPIPVKISGQCFIPLVKFSFLFRLPWCFPPPLGIKLNISDFFTSHITTSTVEFQTPFSNPVTCTGRVCPDVTFSYDIINQTYDKIASSVDDIQKVIGSLTKRAKTEVVTDDILSAGELPGKSKISLIEYTQRKLKVARRVFQACMLLRNEQASALRSEALPTGPQRCLDTFKLRAFYSQNLVDKCKKPCLPPEKGGTTPTINFCKNCLCGGNNLNWMCCYLNL